MRQPASVKLAGSGTHSNGFSLDLDPVALANQRANLQQGVGRPDVAEVSAVHCAHILPVAGVAQVDAAFTLHADVMAGTQS